MRSIETLPLASALAGLLPFLWATLEKRIAVVTSCAQGEEEEAAPAGLTI